MFCLGSIEIGASREPSSLVEGAKLGDIVIPVSGDSSASGDSTEFENSGTPAELRDSEEFGESGESGDSVNSSDSGKSVFSEESGNSGNSTNYEESGDSGESGDDAVSTRDTISKAGE